MSVKIKKGTYKLRVFAGDLVLVLEGSSKGIKILMRKLKEVFKINKQKTVMLTKIWYKIKQNKMGFKFDKVKSLAMNMTNMDGMHFQNNYLKTWNEV